MSKNVRSLMTIVLVLVMALGVFATECKAGGWLDNVQTIDLDTTHNDSISNSDYQNGAYYYDVYQFTMPQKGIINIYTESVSDLCVCGRTEYKIYKVSNVDSKIWSGHRGGDDYKYSSARDIYYGPLNVILDSGTYYLVQICDRFAWDNRNNDINYDITLKYTPNITSPQIKSVLGGKKSIKVSWYKVADATGYELQYSTNKKLKKATTVVIDKDSTINKTIKKLKKEKKYYIRLRSCKSMSVAGTAKVYKSKWSETKEIRTK